jgi:tripartite ATP-independent transporter DctM subunit
MLILMFTRMWVGYSMMLVGFVGCGLLGGWSGILNMAGTIGYVKIADYAMSCVPLFIFMGCILFHTNLGEDIYRVARAWLSRVRGGLAVATIGACGIFAAICGDSVATAVTMGKVSYPEMKRYGYSDKLATCCNCAGGTIGVMIPPSIPFIIYGVMTEQSIGQLFMAGVVPGLLQVLGYMVTVYIWCKINPSAGPTGSKYPMREKIRETRNILPIVIIFGFMFGGMYGGLFTPTEAGAFSAFFTLIVALAMRRLTKRNFLSSIQDALQTVCMVFFLILGAFLFTRFMLLSDLASLISESMLYLHFEIGLPPGLIVVILVLFYIFLGCFLDTLAALLLTLPFVYPIITGLGLDPIWWGVIMVRVMEIGMISPPFGLNLFSLAKSVDMDIGTMYRGIWPFLVSDTIQVLLLAIFPVLSLYLPSHM